MCGIFCSISSKCHLSPSERLASRLQSRGPDSQAHVHLTCSTSAGGSVENEGSSVFVTLYSTVLSLRGDTTVRQPYQDGAAKFTLCWNGEAWSTNGELVRGNDTEMVHRLLSNALQTSSSVGSSNDARTNAGKISRALSMVAGPYAFLFFDHANSTIFFGRDFLGRRSLLMKTTATGELLISSISDGSDHGGWTELDPTGVHYVNLGNLDTDSAPPGAQSYWSSGLDLASVSYYSCSSADTSDEFTQSVIPHLSLNQDVPCTTSLLSESSQSVTQLEILLRDSLALRTVGIPEPPLRQDMTPEKADTRLAILFSGGLDCTMLARISHNLLPVSEAIDLLNVAFENPRIHRHNTKEADTVIDVYGLCPDRITGQASYAELQRVCPGRTWRFVSINIPYAEFSDHRELVISLMHPHNTEMDLSIASALYFAARGQGQVSVSPNSAPKPYTTNARVLLSGLGADEIFAGYTRHATAFKRSGFTGLLDELQLDVSRLGRRNLGRDDRVMSHWSKEVRYPYLDERLLTWALNAPVVEKCGFGEKDTNPADGDGSTALEPGKKALRCLAWKLGMREVAREKKRAIQFGARTAKMETGRSKGTYLVS